MAYIGNIIEKTKGNTYFREVLATGPHSQLVVMCIPPNGEIGEEVHQDVDQILMLITGQGAAVLDGQRNFVRPGELVLVPAGTRHNIVNTGTLDLRLFTVYSPPEHAPGTIHRTKADADAAEAEGVMGKRQRETVTA
jgi:mannose-6-phosphate isomerase-like protein (cupin superfamily)